MKPARSILSLNGTLRIRLGQETCAGGMSPERVRIWIWTPGSGYYRLLFFAQPGHGISIPAKSAKYMIGFILCSGRGLSQVTFVTTIL